MIRHPLKPKEKETQNYSKIMHPQQTIVVYPQHAAYTVFIQSGC